MECPSWTETEIMMMLCGCHWGHQQWAGVAMVNVNGFDAEQDRASQAKPRKRERLVQTWT
jgi:hypothetical protein